MTMIKLTKGDDLNALNNDVTIVLNTDVDLTNYRAVFQLQDFQQEWSDVTSKKLSLNIPAEASKKFKCGQFIGGIKLYDEKGLGKTICKDIIFLIEPEVVKNGTRD